MSAHAYLTQAADLLLKIRDTQLSALQAAAGAMARSITAGRGAYLFGSGHSVIPTMDAFPRYGSFVGLRPLYDPRLMWFNVIGPGGARELLWVERTEGYIANFVRSYELDSRDTLVVYSHGGLNAAPVEMAMAGKERGLTVVGVTCVANRELNRPTHSSGKSLADVADIVIDNCSPPEDALVSIPGVSFPVGASSTVTAVSITMALLAQTALELAQTGHPPEWVFVSPNVPGVRPDHNQQVFEEYTRFQRRMDAGETL